MAISPCLPVPPPVAPNHHVLLIPAPIRDILTSRASEVRAIKFTRVTPKGGRGQQQSAEGQGIQVPRVFAWRGWLTRVSTSTIPGNELPKVP